MTGIGLAARAGLGVKGGSDEAANLAGFAAGWATGAASDRILGNSLYNTVTNVNGINGGMADDLIEGGADAIKGGTGTNTLTNAQKSRLNALENTINDHLTEGDFSGTLRDLQGNPVSNGKGGYFDHMGEMQDSYKSLQKIKKALEGSLKNPNLSDVDRALLQEGLDKANSYVSRIEDLFDPYGGIK